MSDSNSTSTGKNILIIDDDPIINFVTTTTFRKYDEGLSTIEYTSPEAGLEYLLNKKIDILLLDLNMPLLSGWEILDKITEHQLKIDVYIVTSSISEYDRDRADTYKCVKKFISKPLPIEFVGNIVNGAKI